MKLKVSSRKAATKRWAFVPQRFAKGFDPALVKAMMDAFDQACDRLGIERTHDEMTARLATAIVAAAHAGERDPDKIRTVALRSLARA